MPRDFDINRIYEPPTAPTTAAGFAGGDSSRASVIPPRSPRRRRLLAGIILLLIVALLLALVLHVTGRLAVSSQSTATSTPAPVVLYQADWTHGLGAWTLPPDWHLVDGYMENDGNGTASLLVPYYVTAENYTIEADLTVQNVPSYRACHSYGIEGLNSGGEQFVGEVSCILTGAVNHAFSQAIVTHADSARDGLSTNDTAVTYSTRTYVIQVRRYNMEYCEGIISCLANVNSTTPLWPMHIAIEDIGVQLTLTRLVITTP